MNGQAARKEVMGVGDEQKASFEKQGKWKKKTLLSKNFFKNIAKK
jgi:hypothetical protein